MNSIRRVLFYDKLRKASSMLLSDGYQYAFVSGRQLIENKEYEIFKTVSGVEAKVASGIAEPLPAPHSHKLGIKLTNVIMPVNAGDTIKPKP